MEIEQATELGTGPQLQLEVNVNGTDYTRSVEPRMLLSDFLRHELELTGTHVGCEHGVCGACTVLMDGKAVRACLLFAIQAQKATIETVESLAAPNGSLSPLQESFKKCHALQCGFCTPGFLMTLKPFLEESKKRTEDDIRSALAGNICRCTGYHNIVKAVKDCIGNSEQAE